MHDLYLQLVPDMIKLACHLQHLNSESIGTVLHAHFVPC
jgi:trehalose-6-phosphate synthase